MDIPYVDDSGFLDPCERTIRECRATLDAGQPVQIELDAEKPGYPGRVVVEIRAGGRNAFSSDYESTDATRFPARIRAAATALYNCGCSGRFRITHCGGVVKITQA